MFVKMLCILGIKHLLNFTAQTVYIVLWTVQSNQLVEIFKKKRNTKTCHTYIPQYTSSLLTIQQMY